MLLLSLSSCNSHIVRVAHMHNWTLQMRHRWAIGYNYLCCGKCAKHFYFNRILNWTRFGVTVASAPDFLVGNCSFSKQRKISNTSWWVKFPVTVARYPLAHPKWSPFCDFRWGHWKRQVSRCADWGIVLTNAFWLRRTLGKIRLRPRTEYTVN